MLRQVLNKMMLWREARLVVPPLVLAKEAMVKKMTQQRREESLSQKLDLAPQQKKTMERVLNA